MTTHGRRSAGLTARLAVLVPAMLLMTYIPASAQDAKRIAVAVLPLKAAKGTDPSFAQLGTTEARALLTKATWLLLTETDRVDRVLGEIAKSRTPDYSQEQALEVGRQVKAEWVCSGSIEVFISHEDPKDPLNWTASATISLDATSVSSGDVRQLGQPIQHTMMGIRADGARKLVADCARTAGQMAGDQIARWIVPVGSVVEVDGKRCLIDLGSDHGLRPKLKFEVSYRDSIGPGRVKTKTATITLDQVGNESSGGKLPGKAEFRVGDRATLAPELRSSAGSGMSSIFRGIASAVAANPNNRAALGDTTQPAYVGPSIEVRKKSELQSDPGGGEGTSGDGPGLFEIQFQPANDDDLNAAGPSGIAFTPRGEMLVTDAPSGKLLVYGPDGVMRREHEFRDLDEGPPRLAHGVAVDRRGVAYFGEHSGCRIFKLEGEQESVFASCPGGAGNFRYLPAVAVDASGFVYVAGWAGQVMKLSSSGDVVATWDSVPGDARIAMMHVNAISICPDGNLAVLDDHGRRIIRFSPSGAVVQVLSLNFPGGASSVTHDALVVDREGYSWILPQFGDDLLVVAPDGRRTSRARRVLPAGVRPDAIGLDPQGNLCVHDSDGLRYRKYRIEHGGLSFEAN